MIRYCERCKDFHEENDMCPKYKEQLKAHPEWLAEAADFANVAAQYQLVTSQTLDKVCQSVNKIAGSNLTYEGTHQAARDIQVFAKLNSDSFRLSGQFANAETAKETLEKSTEGFQRYLKGRLNGTGEEIDWLRQQQGRISSLWQKSTLPNGNTVGYDGETVNRLTGNVIQKTSIKAAEGSAGLHTNAKDIIEALKKGTLAPNEAVTGVKGTKEAVQKALDKAIAEAAANGDTETLKTLTAAKEQLQVSELGSTAQVKESTERLTQKIKNGQANTSITSDMVKSHALQGAVIGAVIGLTIASITNYIKLKNGEITREEAFRNIGEDSVKGVITGGAMGAISIFLPGGAIGIVAGVAIGMYIGAVTGNVLDEIFGKGAYEQILNACGYVAGTAKNVVEMLQSYGQNIKTMDESNKHSHVLLNKITEKEQRLQADLNNLENIMEEL